MKYQHTVQLGTFSIRVDQQVNDLLRQNPTWALVNLLPLPVHRIGGNDQHVLAVFETDDDGGTGTAPVPFRESGR